jgi:hypothetical protein
MWRNLASYDSWEFAEMLICYFKKYLKRNNNVKEKAAEYFFHQSIPLGKLLKFCTIYAHGLKFAAIFKVEFCKFQGQGRST